jgi:hypothetical protein
MLHRRHPIGVQRRRSGGAAAARASLGQFFLKLYQTGVGSKNKVGDLKVTVKNTRRSRSSCGVEELELFVLNFCY